MRNVVLPTILNKFYILFHNFLLKLYKIINVYKSVYIYIYIFIYLYIYIFFFYNNNPAF